MALEGIYQELTLEVNEFFYSIGFFGELIMILLTTGLLFNQTIDLTVYYIGLLFNQLLNRLLKPVFKGARPSNPIKFLASEHFTKNSITYGMPSGHSQSVFYSLTYLYFALGKFYPWLCFAGVIGIATIIERLVHHNHTILQLLAGAVLGSLFGYSVFYLHAKIKNYL
jgi:membrane-associated phospholipid phosphatase